MLYLRVASYISPSIGATHLWFSNRAGKLAISVRYGSKVLELAKGKFAVEFTHEKDLTKTLDAIKTAVVTGELDAQIDAAATKLRAGFTK